MSSHISLRYALLSLTFGLALPAHSALLGWWKFDEASGTVAADSSGQTAANGTLVGGATFQPAAGKFGGAVYLNGTSGYVDAGDTARFEFAQTQSYSVACWYKSDGDETVAEFQTNSGLVSKGYGRVTNGGSAANTYDPLGYYQLQVNWSTGAGVTTSYFQFDSRQSSAANVAFRFPTTFTNGLDVVNSAWHHFVAVVDRAAATPVCRLYVDNTAYATKNIVAGAGGGIWPMGVNNSPLLFGNHLDRYTKGWMDDVGIWDVVLTPTQITNIYTNGIAGLGDTDGDGLSDAWETLYFGNLTPLPSDNTDNDGLTHLEEQTAGTNPTIADTDTDGLTDGAEVLTHLTNPLVVDTDGDGLSDGNEVNTRGTNPKLADTDGDAFTDGEEVTAGTDPLLASSHPAPGAVNVHLNEFVSENLPRPNDPTAPIDMDADYTDWLEIRNNEATAVNLRYYQLSDDPALPAKYVFPSVSIPAGGYLLVYASGKNRAITGVQLHTNFKLSSPGILILSRPDGAGGNVVVSQLGATGAKYPAQKQTVSYGRTDNTAAGALQFLLTPTPGVANNAASAVADFVKDTSFDVDRGLYSAPITVHITTVTPGATIAYTVNGSAPTATNGIQVPPVDGLTPPVATVNISTTTLLRARAIKTGLGPSNIDTQSYIFPAEVMTQNAPTPSMGVGTAADTVTGWGLTGTTPMVLTAFPGLTQWGVNQLMATDPVVSNQFKQNDLMVLPTLSLVADWKGLFGPNTGEGIYPPAAGVAVEGADRVASLELLNPGASNTTPNTIKGFQTDGNIHVFGGTSQGRWKSLKLSMRFQCVDTVNYSLYGNDGINRFSNFVLDSAMNNTWMHPTDAAQRTRSAFSRDYVMSDLQNKISGVGGFHSKACHLYLNGMYWGIYWLHEKPDHHFASDYYGGSSGDYDVFKHSMHPAFTESDPLVNALPQNLALPLSKPSGGSIGNSTTATNYEAFLDLIGSGNQAPNPAPDLTQAANYNAVADVLDIDHFIDYMMLNFVAGNQDWSDKNLYCSKSRLPGGKWRFSSWDAEHVFRTGTENFIAGGGNEVPRNGQPKDIHNKLRVNAEYKLKFADHIRKHMFNDGALTPPVIKDVFDFRHLEITDAIRAESARWGHARASLNGDVPYKRSNWFTETQRITISESGGVSLIQNRWNLYMAPTTGQFRLATYSLYPTTEAPDLVQHGGNVASGYALTINNPNAGGAGITYYTTDGSDPRVIGGAVAAGALTYSAPVILTQSTTVRSRILNAGTWSALTEANYGVDTTPATPVNLVISEINYNPSNATLAEVAAGFNNANDFEYVEIMNIGTSNVSLEGVEFTAGIVFHFNNSSVQTIAPGQRVVLVENLLAFRMRYGNTPVVAGIFELDSNLRNNGETLTLTAADGVTEIQSVTYDNNAPWPDGTDGLGYSLVLVKPETNPDEKLPENWRASATANNGSPGATDSASYTAWKALHSVSLDTADADKDGVSNLLEYALQTLPNDTQSANLPTGGWAPFTVIGVPDNYLQLTFTRNPAADDITYHVKYTTDLSNWSQASTDCTRVSTTPNPDGTVTEVWRSAQPVPNVLRAFMKLEVTYP
jgi:hypothetical protein